MLTLTFFINIFWFFKNLKAFLKEGSLPSFKL
jgi:hypothetical protein